MDRLLESFSAACERRRALFGRLEMFRVFDARGDGIPGMFADRFGEVLLLHIQLDDRGSSDLVDAVRKHADAIARLAGVSTVYLRIHETSARRSAENAVLLLCGSAYPELELQEHGIRYRICFEENVNAGLFLDTRDLRASLLDTSKGRRVLNTFCFTGSLGLAAFCGGAREVVQVDISKSILNWARQNYVLNQGAGTGEMRFICEDSRAFMRREIRRREAGKPGYDTVIIDPPTFGSCRKVRFRFERDVGELADLAVALTEDGGEIILCTNLSTFSRQALLEILQASAEREGRNLLDSTEVSPPDADFTDRSPETSGLRGVRVRLKG